VDTKEAPVKYRTTWLAIVICMLFTIAAAGVLRLLMARANARMDAAAAARGALDEGVPEKGAARVGDVIQEEQEDREDLRFRYTL
jgi:hypothetical protein